MIEFVMIYIFHIFASVISLKSPCFVIQCWIQIVNKLIHKKEQKLKEGQTELDSVLCTHTNESKLTEYN